MHRWKLNTKTTIHFRLAKNSKVRGCECPQTVEDDTGRRRRRRRQVQAQKRHSKLHNLQLGVQTFFHKKFSRSMQLSWLFRERAIEKIYISHVYNDKEAAREGSESKPQLLLFLSRYKCCEFELKTKLRTVASCISRLHLAHTRLMHRECIFFKVTPRIVMLILYVDEYAALVRKSLGPRQNL